MKEMVVDFGRRKSVTINGASVETVQKYRFGESRNIHPRLPAVYRSYR